MKNKFGLFFVLMVGLPWMGDAMYGGDEKKVETSSQGSKKINTGENNTIKPIAFMDKKESPIKTPGQKISEKQRELLTRGNFTTAFGEEAIAEADKKDVDFNIFSYVELEPDNPYKRNNLKKIKEIAAKYEEEGFDKEKGSKFYSDILRLQDQLKKMNVERIKEILKTPQNFKLIK